MPYQGVYTVLYTSQQNSIQTLKFLDFEVYFLPTNILMICIIHLITEILSIILPAIPRNQNLWRGIMKKIYTLCLVLITSFQFVACTTPREVVEASESFQYNSIKNERMIVGGVISSVEELKPRERIKYSNQLRTHFNEKRNQLSVAPVGIVVSQMGRKNYNDLIEDYKNTGVVDAKWMQTLQSRVKGRRYVIFASIDSDDINKFRNDIVDRDSKGNTIEGSEKVEVVTSRSISGSLKVLDLKQGKVVWSDSVTKGLSNRQTYKRENTSGIVSILNAVRGNAESEAAKYPFPQAPSKSRLIQWLFEGFAENMPEAGK